MMSPEEQLERIAFGAADLISREELLKKLKKCQQDSKSPCGLNLGQIPIVPTFIWATPW
jgi:hypothetical protein